MDTLQFGRNPQTGAVVITSEEDFRSVFHRFSKSPGTVARSIGDAARKFISAKTRELHFSNPVRSYEDSAREIYQRHPEAAALALAPIGDDDAFYRSMGIEVRDYGSDDND
jgi:hypothetical protein